DWKSGTFPNKSYCSRGNYLQVGDSVLAIIKVIITPGVIIRGGEGLKTPIYGGFLRFFPFYALNAY
ncbi:MAG TPA: hypothetical protein P5315_11965, partial [Clostridia bacterium]|nr:hypothetical protein [Clostridia bacterium]